MGALLFPRGDHDHDRCKSALMKIAESRCHDQGLRLTRLRRDILREVAAGHKAVGAYEILDKLAERGEKLAPISVYRCLEFLEDAGLIHKLRSTNAYFVCQSAFDGAQRDCCGESLVLLICSNCRRIGELDGGALTPVVERFAQDNGFDNQQTHLEILGLCQDCQSLPSDRDGAPC